MRTIPARRWRAAAPFCMRTAFDGTSSAYCTLHPDAKPRFEDTPDDMNCDGVLRCPSCDAKETPRRRSADSIKS